MAEFTRSRMAWLIAIVTLAAALAWTGALDSQSMDYLDGALVGSGAIYATARSINALVSVLQGTELDAVVLTFTVGELLDPVNDLIERFSGVMLIAMGSLAIQKILLEVVSHAFFNLLLSLLGTATLIAHFAANAAMFSRLWRIFAVTVIVRFLLVFMVLASGWADAVFLKQSEAANHASVRAFEGELNQISSKAGLRLQLAADTDETNAALAVNERARDIERGELNRLRAERGSAVRELNTLDQRNWWQRLTQDTTVEIEGKRAQITALERDIRGREQTLAALEDNREAMQGKLDCIERRSRGDNCSLAETIDQAVASLDIARQIESLEDSVNVFASDLINLLMSVLLKSVLFPLLFLYLLLRLAGRLL
ncbi:MAG: hypothetical protein AAGI11_01945 [Pseudomonadota bacterium]